MNPPNFFENFLNVFLQKTDYF